MATRKMFGRSEILRTLELVSLGLGSEMRAYLIGGLAMMVHGIKIATKDVDLVFATGEEALEFKTGIGGSGFNDLEDLPPEYRDLEASSIMQRADGMRFDIFVGSVCGCLVLSEGMKARSVELGLPGKLRLQVVSPEDIFLLKSVSGREGDILDMGQLAGRGLDWRIIETEIAGQPDHWRWLGHTYENLLELERVQGVVTPLTKRFEEEAEVIAGIAVVSPRLARSGMTIEEASTSLGGVDEAFASLVLNRMVALGLAVKEDGTYSKGPRWR